MSEHPAEAISFFRVCLGWRDSLCSTRGRIILVCVCASGLVMRVLGGGRRPLRAQLGCSVSLLDDMLTFTAPPPSLCCSHHRDSGLTAHQKSQSSINLLCQPAVNGG